MRQEFYIQNEDGSITIDHIIDDGIPDPEKEGEVALVPTTGGARIRVFTQFAGLFITLQRVQVVVSNIGNIAMVNVVNGISFDIRSTSALDAGTIKWKLIEE